jgi:regulator of RNase E activity RraA
MGIDPLPLDTDTVRSLSGVTTATLTTVLLKKGLRNVWMRGARPLHARRAAAAGIFGDILCGRMKQRAVAALLSDGVVRDVQGVMATGLPVWCQGTAAPV